MSRSTRIFLAALAAAASFALAKIAFATPNAYFFYYTLPIAVPFAAFVIERALDRRGVRAASVDVIVIGLALSRMFHPLPFVSGHVLFTTYALATGRTWATRWTAASVLASVYVLKLFFWHDFVTPVGASIIALAGWWLHVRLWVPRTPPRSSITSDESELT